MTATPPSDGTTTEAPARRTHAATAALYLAIGALVIAAVLGAYFIIAGDQANVAGRAWLTLFLVVLFAGAVVLDANVGTGPNRWYLGASTIVNVVIVAVGLLKLWNGWLQPEDTAAASVWAAQFGRLLAVVVLLRLALLFMQLYGLAFVTRGRTQGGKIMAIGTIVLVWAMALVLAIPATLPEYAWPEWWWRLAGGIALVAVVTTVIPLLLRAFDPNKPAKPAQPVQPVQQSGYAPVQQAPGYYAQQPAQVPVQQPVQQPYPAQYPQQPVHPAVPVPQPGSQPAPPVPPAPAGPQPGSQPPPPAPAPQAAPPAPPIPPGAPTPPQ